MGLTVGTTIVLFIKAENLSAGNWAHHDFGFPPPNSWWSQFFPETGPEEERREKEEIGWRADGREGREKGRKEKH